MEKRTILKHLEEIRKMLARVMPNDGNSLNLCALIRDYCDKHNHISPFYHKLKMILYSYYEKVQSSVGNPINGYNSDWWFGSYEFADRKSIRLDFLDIVISHLKREIGEEEYERRLAIKHLIKIRSILITRYLYTSDDNDSKALNLCSVINYYEKISNTMSSKIKDLISTEALKRFLYKYYCKYGGQSLFYELWWETKHEYGEVITTDDFVVRRNFLDRVIREVYDEINTKECTFELSPPSTFWRKIIKFFNQENNG